MAQSTVIYSVPVRDKWMALTFDDGSDSVNTKRILNILSAYNVVSTFFMTGEMADYHPDSARLILQYGHELGNHSYSHPQFTQLDTSTMRSEIAQAEEAIFRATGTDPKPFFRPPYGDYNGTVLEVVQAAGYPWTIMWTIDTLDWNGTPADTMVQNVLENAQPGAIVLMHLGSGTYTPDALPVMIQELSARGYRFTTLSALLSITSPPSTSHPTLRMGDTGGPVVELQQDLVKLGFNPGPVDGIFGSRTQAAVMDFQRAKGLEVDGIVGPLTWGAIDSALQGETPPAPPTPPSPPPSTSHPTLRIGDTGGPVVDLQESLAQLRYNPGPIDGIFGPRTQAAVMDFQQDYGLVVDGIVGPQTWSAIDHAL